MPLLLSERDVRALDPARPGTLREVGEPWKLRFFDGDDDLAATLVRNAFALAEPLEELLAAQASARLERTGPIVDAGVDDARVAPALMPRDRGFLLEHDDARTPRQLDERGRGRQPDDAASDDRDVRGPHAGARR